MMSAVTNNRAQPRPPDRDLDRAHPDDDGGLLLLVAAEPSSAVRHAAAAWRLATEGAYELAAEQITEASAALTGLGRRERHVVAVFTLAAGGSVSRAAGLAAEHLVEFPGDRLVALIAARLEP